MYEGFYKAKKSLFHDRENRINLIVNRAIKQKGKDAKRRQQDSNL